MQQRSSALLICASILALVGCVSSSTNKTITSAEASAGATERAQAPDAAAARAASTGAAPAPKESTSAAAAPSAPPLDEAALARPIDLKTAEASALARHPALLERAYRVRALAEQARSEGRLPPPMLGVDLWQVPLNRPYAVQDAQMLMVSLTQEIPAPGSLDLMASATALEARAAAVMIAAEGRMLLRDVDRAFAEYVEVYAELAAHRQHLSILGEMEAAARARYVARGSLGDATKAALERVKLEAQVARDAARVEEARAMLNGAMARPVNAPLGPPVAGDPLTVDLSAEQVADRADAKSPEIAAADAMREAAQGQASARDREDSLPSFTVGISYFHPVGEMRVAGWGASLGMSLPWIWGAASSRTASAEQRSLAEAAAASGARLRVRSEAGRALAAVRGAAMRFAVLRDSGRPAAARALAITGASYAAGGSDILMWLDAERSALDIEIDLAMARGDLDRALADLDAAVGERVPRAPLPAARTAEPQAPNSSPMGKP